MPTRLLLEGKVCLVDTCGACLMMICVHNLNGRDDRRSGIVHVHHVGKEGMAHVRVRCACISKSRLIVTDSLALRYAYGANG